MMDDTNATCRRCGCRFVVHRMKGNLTYICESCLRKKIRRDLREQALEELVDQAQELDMGYEGK